MMEALQEAVHNLRSVGVQREIAEAQLAGRNDEGAN